MLRPLKQLQCVQASAKILHFGEAAMLSADYVINFDRFGPIQGAWVGPPRTLRNCAIAVR
jgi:hypothetical protein